MTDRMTPELVLQALENATFPDGTEVNIIYQIMEGMGYRSKYPTDEETFRKECRKVRYHLDKLVKQGRVIKEKSFYANSMNAYRLPQTPSEIARMRILNDH